MRGFSFSLKRFLVITAAKQQIVRQTGIATTKSGMERERGSAQYPQIAVHELNSAHDRFLIIDQNQVYHIGASLKDLGKKHVVSEVESMVRVFENGHRSTENVELTKHYYFIKWSN